MPDPMVLVISSNKAVDQLQVEGVGVKGRHDLLATSAGAPVLEPPGFCGQEY